MIDRRTHLDGTAVVLFAAEFVLIYVGLTYTTASRSVPYLYTAPFVVAIGAHLLLPSERLGALQWAGLVCAFAGTSPRPSPTGCACPPGAS
jgi:drug/metabolite transporter (DMT)-like permease